MRHHHALSLFRGSGLMDVPSGVEGQGDASRTSQLVLTPDG